MRSKLFVLALFAYGCTGTTNNYYFLDAGASGGGGDGGQLCTPGAKDCVTSTLARICSPDGLAWIGLPCAAGLTCSMGDCNFDPMNTVCAQGQSMCASNTAVQVCNMAGNAFTMMNCPGSTLCINGLCVGACTVGESRCDSSGTVVLTCSDGTTFTPMPCPANNFCLSTTTTSPPLAQCAPATVCQPDPGGCNTVCGDKTNPANDPTKYTSTCVLTPTGYGWQITQCPIPQTCDPSGGPSCGTNIFVPSPQAGCRSQCVPGQQRCAADGVSTQVCGTDGNWGATTPCDTTTGQVCIFSTATCGDLACSTGAMGICVLDMGVSKLRACTNGKLAPDLTACTMGLCAPDPRVKAPPSGPKPGACFVECQMGDSRCQGNALQGCGANGTWSATTTPCGGTKACFESISSTGRPKAICGVCLPGSHQCTDAAGTMGATGGFIETCDATGAWGAATACATGYGCALAAGAADPSCQQQCVPGQKLCLGIPSTVGGNAIAGTSQSGVCPSNGLLVGATPTNCPAGQSCRTDQAGNALGCVVCVGGMNENGIVDTRCSNVTGTATSGTYVQTCKSDSISWDTTTLVACAGTATTTCVNGQPKINLHQCGDCPGYAGIACTDSNLANNFGGSCIGFGFGAPGACGAATDCCLSGCYSVNPAPATCQ